MLGGGPGMLLYQQSTSTTRFVNTGSTGTVLLGSGTNSPFFSPNMAITGWLVVGTLTSTSTSMPTIASGEIRASNEITAYYSSDERLKENIKVLEDPITLVNKLRGVEFDWKQHHIDSRGGEDGYFVRRNDVGVIAQEVQEVLPQVVATRDDGYLAVRYEKIVPLLIEAIKELHKEIDQLKNKN